MRAPVKEGIAIYTVTLDIGVTRGYANFNLRYVPFSLNEAAQDSNTNFGQYDPNANGAVAEEVVFPEDITVPQAWYVASTGSDTAAGARAAPLKTVDKALEKATEAYSDVGWPEKGEATESYAGIVILGTVEVTSQIDIDNRDSIYPPILLTSALSTGGTLQASGMMEYQSWLLALKNGVKVTLWREPVYKMMTSRGYML